MTVSPVDAAAREPNPDPTFEELSATIARYDDWDDKLTIALGNFNRVRAERDKAVSLLAVREADLERLRRIVVDGNVTEDVKAVLAVLGIGKCFAEDDERSHDLLDLLGAPKMDGDERMAIVERLEALAAVPDGPVSE